MDFISFYMVLFAFMNFMYTSHVQVKLQIFIATTAKRNTPGMLTCAPLLPTDQKQREECERTRLRLCQDNRECEGGNKQTARKGKARKGCD